MAKPSYFPYTSATCVECKQKTQYPSNHLHKHTTYFNTPTIFNNGRFTINISTDTRTVTTTDIKTNMRHIHRYIVSRRLATHHLFKFTHICTTLSSLDLWTDHVAVTALLARYTEKLAGGPQAGRSNSPHLKRSWERVGKNKYTC